MGKMQILKRFWWLTLALVLISACSAPGIHQPTALDQPTPLNSPTTSNSTPTLYPTSAPTNAQSSTYSPRLIGYFYGLDRNNKVTDIAPGKLTDLIYAFINVSDSGECVSINPAIDAVDIPALLKLKQQNPGLHILVSVGGYDHSARFSDAALSEASRLVFAQSCVRFMAKNGFDGIDIDWETPVSGGLAGNSHRPEDKPNYTALMSELRSQLDAQGKMDGRPYLLSAAVPAGPSEFAYFEISKIYPYVDWLTVMAYAFYTSASPITHFNAPLYPTSTDPAADDKKRLLYNGNAAVQAYLAAGVPREKISLGVPFYGRAWEGVPADNNGLYQPVSGPFTDSSVPNGTWSRDGVITYRALTQYYLGKWPRFWQPEAQEPWLYNSADRAMVTYDDPQSLGIKADYVKSKQLGGISIWQLSGDDNQHTLLDALYSHLLP